MTKTKIKEDAGRFKCVCLAKFVDEIEMIVEIVQSGFAYKT